MDPYQRYKDGRDQHEMNTQGTAARSSSLAFGDSEASNLGVKADDADGYNKLESLSKNHLKIPLRRLEKETGFVNINRKHPNDYVSNSLEDMMYGKASEAPQKMDNVLRHEYLRKSMVDRIERKSLMKRFRMSAAQENKERLQKPTRTQQLRSQSQLQQTLGQSQS